LLFFQLLPPGLHSDDAGPSIQTPRDYRGPTPPPADDYRGPTAAPTPPQVHAPPAPPPYEDTPQWSDPQILNWHELGGHLSFTDLLSYVPVDTTPPPPPTQDPTTPGVSQWFAESSTSAQVRMQSADHLRDSQAWYDNSYQGGSTYTFTTTDTTREVPLPPVYDGPALAAGVRMTQPPDNYTPDDFVRRQRDRGRGRGRGRRGT